jgi:hypothetical protein
MSFITVIKKIGEKVISVVEWPFKHSAMLGELLVDLEKDTPATKSALVGFVQHVEAIGPDAVAAIATKGLDVPEDLKCGEDVKALFGYIQGTLLPTIEKDYADVKAAQSASDPPPAAGAPLPAPGVLAAGPADAPAAAAVLQPGIHDLTPQ